MRSPAINDRSPSAAGRQVTRQTVDIDGDPRCHTRRIALSQQCANHPGEDVTAASCGHARIAGRINIQRSLRFGDNCMRPLQHDDSLAGAGGLLCRR